MADERSTDTSKLLERLKKYEGRLPADFKFDRLEANTRYISHSKTKGKPPAPTL